MIMVSAENRCTWLWCDLFYWTVRSCVFILTSHFMSILKVWWLHGVQSGFFALTYDDVLSVCAFDPWWLHGEMNTCLFVLMPFQEFVCLSLLSTGTIMGSNNVYLYPHQTISQETVVQIRCACREFDDYAMYCRSLLSPVCRLQALCMTEFPLTGGCTDNMPSRSCFTILLYP